MHWASTSFLNPEDGTNSKSRNAGFFIFNQTPGNYPKKENHFKTSGWLDKEHKHELVTKL
jgi:hypothetical protein